MPQVMIRLHSLQMSGTFTLLGSEMEYEKVFRIKEILSWNEVCRNLLVIAWLL